jgi:hypothetical protein
MRYRPAFVFLAAALAASFALILAGCGSSTSGASSASGSPGAAATAMPASHRLEKAIVKGEFDKGSMTAEHAVVVKSKDFPGVYFVAMKFAAPGAGDQVGVWATQDPQGTTLIWAVDPVAQKYTQWPVTTASDKQNLTMSTDGAQAAVSALQ